MDPNGSYGPGDPGVLLRVAAFLGREDLTRWLLEHGADPALASDEGKTALDVARERGHDAVVNLLERFVRD